MVQDIGSKIYRLRREKKLTQEELAHQRKVSEKEIRDWENGVSVPSVAQAKELADFFSVTIDDLIGDENKKEEKTLVIKEKTKEKVPFINLFYRFYPFILLVLYSVKINEWNRNNGVTLYQNAYDIRRSSGLGIFFLVRIILFSLSVRITAILSVSLPAIRKNSLDAVLLFFRTFGLTLFHVIFCFSAGIFDNRNLLLPYILIPIFATLFSLSMLLYAFRPGSFQRVKSHIRNTNCVWMFSLPLFFCIEYFIVYPLSSFWTPNGEENLWNRFSHIDALEATLAWVGFLVGIACFICGFIFFLLCNPKREKGYRIALRTLRGLSTALTITQVILRQGEGVGVFSSVFFPLFFNALVVGFYFISNRLVKNFSQLNNIQ